ncbi:glycosyltransferase family 4 protein [Paenibacillus sonchi]|uniref:glycosyltransferase family 4 protein n=1 Tax=Paenibacillus sonchi TaxID=373687 RepID=UPI001E3E3B29|nr:glycosyltransferase family 4 protein [Paenibacillus sonchi]MCE3202841.1 glycosyltransferase family 4 protein [Paenibacillus sonchi]
MDILFLGGLFPKDEEKLIYNKSKGVIQFAANILQWNIVNGLEKCLDKPIKLVNSIFVGSYPKYFKEIFVMSRSWKHRNDLNHFDINVGFLNLFGIKQIWRGFSVSKYCKLWAKEVATREKVIIIYSMNTPFIYAAMKAKKANPNIHICLICPDLPEFMNTGKKRGFLFELLKSADRYIMNMLLEYVDSFVFLTKFMIERVDVRNRPWTVLEGIVNTDQLEGHFDLKKEPNQNKYKRILYTGTLNKAYGIMDLLDAFQMLEDDSLQLWICGAGEAQIEVENLANTDKRVIYYGQVSHNEAVKLQHEADLLINPRNNEGEYTKFSFPSKILEYMLSGTPALIYKLPGIPDEYYDYLFTVDGKGAEAIASSIKHIFSQPYRNLTELGKRSREFVISQKNPSKQTWGILDMIKNINKKDKKEI